MLLMLRPYDEWDHDWQAGSRTAPTRTKLANTKPPGGFMCELSGS